MRRTLHEPRFERSRSLFDLSPGSSSAQSSPSSLLAPTSPRSRSAEPAREGRRAGVACCSLCPLRRSVEDPGREGVPGHVRSRVLRAAGQPWQVSGYTGQATVVIEMQHGREERAAPARAPASPSKLSKPMKFTSPAISWSLTSPWSPSPSIPGALPPEHSGKAARFAQELRKKLAPKAVSVVDFPGRKSRFGCFEVHVLQSTWDPERCCPATLAEGQWHQGPAVNRPDGVYCAACAQALQSVRPGHYTKDDLVDQHMLLHSKLASRRWPDFKQLLVRIGTVTIPPPPLLPRPLGPSLEVPPLPVYQELTLDLLTFDRKRRTLPTDPTAGIQRRLAQLDCPRQLGWFLASSHGPETLCQCGGGSHYLSVQEVQSVLAGEGLDVSAFHQFVQQNRRACEGQNVNQFLTGFLEPIVASQRAEWDKIKDLVAQEESSFQSLQALSQALSQQQAQICERYRAEFLEAQQLAEPLFRECSELLASAAEGAGLSGGVSGAKEANDRRRAAWDAWDQVAQAWKELPEVFRARPDLANVHLDKAEAEAKSAEVKTAVDALVRRMQSGYPRRAIAAERLANVREEWTRRTAEYQALVTLMNQ